MLLAWDTPDIQKALGRKANCVRSRPWTVAYRRASLGSCRRRPSAARIGITYAMNSLHDHGLRLGLVQNVLGSTEEVDFVSI